MPFERWRFPQGLKPTFCLALTARLKPCPTQNQFIKHALAKQVLLCGANQVLGVGFGWLIREPANDACGSASQLATDETSGARQFIGDGFDAGAETISVRIAAAAVVVQGFHASGPNRYFCEPLAPRAAETIGDDDGNGKA